MYTIVLLVLIVASLAYFFVPSFLVAKKVLHPRAKTLDDVKRLHEEDDIFQPEFLNGTKKEELTLKSNFGYDIYAFVIYNQKPSNHVVILSHGVTCRSELMFRYLKIFLDAGYNVMFLDHRCHGRTGGPSVSYGYFEKYDLLKAILWAKAHFSGKIGLHGESMGAAISMMAAGLADVDFLIEDCGYSSFAEELRYNLIVTPGTRELIHYPSSRLIIRIRGHYDVEKVCPAEAVADTSMPILIIHGTEDSYVPFSMAETIFNAIQHNRKHIYAPKTGHAYAVKYDTVAYKHQIDSFLKKYDCYFGTEINVEDV